MAVLFVARSAKLARWASDVGFGKHVYKIGVCDEDPKALAKPWEFSRYYRKTDWTIEELMCEDNATYTQAAAPGTAPGQDHSVFHVGIKHTF